MIIRGSLNKQIDNQKDIEKLETIIVKAIKEEKNLDMLKIVKAGITDTSGIMTIFTTLNEVYKKINNE